MAFFSITVPCATPTTTTTTTVAPITFTATPSCVGGSGEIAVTSYAGGNGSYQWIAISSISRNDAVFQAAAGTRFAAGSSYTFSSLADGNYWVALRDTAGNSGATNDPGINIACATTTTTTTTTTTSTTTTTTTGAGNEVSIYFRAGEIINNGDTFDIYTSQDNTNWTLFSIENSSTSCTFYGTVNISSGTIYVKAQRSSDNTQVYIRGANSSTCPANAAINCTYSAAITGTESVAITVYVEEDGFGNFGLVPC
jgi:hypothetical protein